MAREAAERAGKRGRHPRRPARPEAADRRRRRRDRRPAARERDRAHDRGLRRQRRDRLSVSYDGLPEAVTTGSLVYLADGRIRLRVLEAGDDEVRCAVEVGGRVSSHQGLNLPGAEVGLPAAGREDLAWVDFAIEHGIDLLAVSFVRRAEDLRPGRAPRAHRRLGHPGDREDREAAGGRARRGDRQGGQGRDHGRARRPRDRAADRAGPRGPAPPARARRPLLDPLDHRDPDARLDGRLAAPHAGRGLRRRQRDLPGHRRGDALRGDRRRRVPGRGGPGDGPDRARDRARAPYGDWVFNRVESDETDVASSVARAAVGATYTLGLAAIVVPTRSGRTARLVSAHRPRVPVLAISPRVETVRRLNLLFGVQLRDRRGLDRPHRAARGLRPAREVRPGSRSSGDLIAITAGPAPAATGHEPVRDPPGPLISPARPRSRASPRRWR